MSVPDAPTDGLGWLTERQRDGGVDPVPLPAEVTGELWLCGKRAATTRYADPGWGAVVCLVEPHEIAGHHPEYLAWHRGSDARAIWHPIPDLHAPTVEAMDGLARGIASRLVAGDRVLLHCGAGYGRSGTVAVCVLIALGIEDALATVSVARPGAGPEVGAQRELIERFRVARGR
jgi:protein-tyrosine phosphatase